MPEQFDGVIDIAQTGTLPPPPSNVPNIRISLDGDTAGVSVGGGGEDGSVLVTDATGQERITLSLDPTGGNLEIRDATGAVRDRCKADGDIEAIDGAGNKVFHFDSQSATLNAGAAGNEGDLIVRDGAGRQVIHANGSNAALYLGLSPVRKGSSGNAGDLIVRDGMGRQVIHANGDNAALYVGAEGNEGDVVVRDGAGRQVIHGDGNAAWLRVGTSGNEGDIEVQDGSGRRVFFFDGSSAALYLGAEGNEGDLIVRDGAGRQVIHANGDNAALYVGAEGNEGDVVVRDGTGTTRIHLDGNEGDIRLFGADCAESFEVAESDVVEPGTVLVAKSGDVLSRCQTAYDQRVVGIVSGGGDVGPGIVLGSFSNGDRAYPVALAGKVYCKVDASYAPIDVGDLLTTSPTAGFAMKATDRLRAPGTVIGKALAGHALGRGLIPVLVALQ